MDSRPSFIPIAATALTFLFGWQALRVLVALMSSLLRDRLSWGMAELGAFSLVLYLASFLGPVLRRLLGSRRLFAISAAGAGLLRLALQAWTGDPKGELALALAATLLFFVFLSVRLVDATAAKPAAGTAMDVSMLAVGCWLGLALDSALHGAYGTYDLSWRSGAAGRVVVFVLFVVQAWLVRRELGDADAWRRRAAQVSIAAPWIWLGFGAFLFLEVMVFQNMARLTVALPLCGAWTRRPVTSTAGGFPVRVMTYNVHCGFDPWGHMGLDATAATIAAQDPDVVALQEVPRGWAMCGSVDLLEGLSQRLGMPYMFAPASDPLWGNAVLSRLPILGHETHELPSGTRRLRRGFVEVRLDVGEERPLRVIATHFHYPRRGFPYRVRQAETIAGFWQGRERTVLLGDLNAQPDEAAVDVLREAGLRDAFEMSGTPPGFTFSSRRPVERIDYVWLSPDLVASDLVVTPELTSDHLGVAARIAPRALTPRVADLRP